MAQESEKYPIYTLVIRYYLVDLDSSTFISQCVFLRFTVFTFILDELWFLNGIRHCLVEADGNSAVLMTMALNVMYGQCCPLTIHKAHTDRQLLSPVSPDGSFIKKKHLLKIMSR